jgi:hypothetical protein
MVWGLRPKTCSYLIRIHWHEPCACSHFAQALHFNMCKQMLLLLFGYICDTRVVFTPLTLLHIIYATQEFFLLHLYCTLYFTYIAHFAINCINMFSMCSALFLLHLYCTLYFTYIAHFAINCINMFNMCIALYTY